MKTKTKILFVNRCLPYEIGGTPVGVRNLLQNFNPDDIVVLGRTVNPQKKLEKESIKYKMYEIPTPYIKGMRLWRFLSIIPGFLIGLYIIRKYKVKKLIGIYPDEGSLLLGYLLGKLTSVDFYPYFFDLYKEFVRGNWQDKVANELQKWSFKSAKKILCLTGGMERYYKENYNITAIVIPNVINKAINKKNCLVGSLQGKFKIAYSGSINEDRLDAFQAFTKCTLNNPKYELYYFTSQSSDILQKMGVLGENTFIKFCSSQEKLLKELQKCDLLYLPLSFNPGEAKLANMMTCFGTKTYEYLITGKPILIHSPENYFNYQFLKENNSAYTLKSIEVDDIRNCLQKIEEEYERAIEKVENAYMLSTQFSGELIKEKVLAIINS